MHVIYIIRQVRTRMKLAKKGVATRLISGVLHPLNLPICRFMKHQTANHYSNLLATEVSALSPPSGICLVLVPRYGRIYFTIFFSSHATEDLIDSVT